MRKSYSHLMDILTSIPIIMGNLQLYLAFRKKYQDEELSLDEKRTSRIYKPILHLVVKNNHGIKSRFYSPSHFRRTGTTIHITFFC